MATLNPCLAGVASSDPLYAQKRALIVALGADEAGVGGTWLDLKPQPSECLLMAPLLRLAHLQVRCRSHAHAADAVSASVT